MALRLNTVHNQDCLEGLKQLGDGVVDLAFADPPFNIGYDYDVYEDQLDRERILDWSRDMDRPRSSACSSPTAPSGWPSAMNTRPN